MARLYTNENVPLQLVMELRSLGHDVQTSLDAGNANRAVPDKDVLAWAARNRRILISLNRRDFIRLHEKRTDVHGGIVVCTFDSDFAAHARRIDRALASAMDMTDQLVRVHRGK